MEPKNIGAELQTSARRLKIKRLTSVAHFPSRAYDIQQILTNLSKSFRYWQQLLQTDSDEYWRQKIELAEQEASDNRDYAKEYRNSQRRQKSINYVCISQPR